MLPPSALFLAVSCLFLPEKLERVGPCRLLKLRWTGTQRVQMKGVLPWLVHWAWCAGGTRDFCSALAALAAQYKIFLSSPYTISMPLPPSPSKLGRQPYRVACLFVCVYTDKKENQIFLIYKESQSGAVATASSYIGKYLRISSYIRKPFLTYDFATAPLWISLYMRKIRFSFFQCIVFTHKRSEAKLVVPDWGDNSRLWQTVVVPARQPM